MTGFPGGERYAQYFRPIDRLRDLYGRKLLPKPIIAFIDLLKPIIELLRIKNGLNGLLLGNNLSALKPRADISIQERLNNILETDADNFYNVRPFTGPKWLRIMIILARKKD